MLDASPTALRAFVLVATHRSFSKAAQLLGTRQSTISSQIARLEELVGQPLLQRSTRRVELAPAGKRLLPLAEEIVELHTVAAARVHDAALTGSIRFACSEALWTSFAVAEAIGRFARSHPEVMLSVALAGESEVARQLADGAVDLCLATDPEVPGSGRLICRERLRWYGRAPDAQHGLPVTLIETPFPSALAAIQAVVTFHGDPPAGSGKTRFTRGLSGAPLAGAAQAISSGMGVGALPAGYAEALGAPAWQGELPALPSIDVYLLGRDQAGDASVALRNHLLHRLPRNARTAGEPSGSQRSASAKRAR